MIRTMRIGRYIMMIAAVISVMTGINALAAKPVAAKDTLTARRVFVDLPVENLDILSKSTRLDMLDFYDIDSIYQARNGMEGISLLEKVTPEYLKVKITPVTTMEIRILDAKKSQLALCIYTIGSDVQAPDSDLTFFNEEMQALNRDKYIKWPSLSDFFDYPDKEAREKVETLVPFPTIEFEANPDNTELTAQLTVGRFMSSEDYDSIKGWLRPPLKFRWNGSKYELVK